MTEGANAERTTDGNDCDVGAAVAIRNGDGVGQRSGDVVNQLRIETANASTLLETLADVIGDDADLVATSVEGETNLYAAVALGIGRIERLSDMASSLDAAIKRMQARRDRFEAQAATIKELIAVAIETTGLSKIETPVATVSLRKLPQSVMIIEESAIPARFWKPQDPKLDKRELLKALKDEGPLPGAMLTNGGRSLNIKAS